MKKYQLRNQLDSSKTRIRELEAQLVHQHHFADANIDKCSTEKLLGSAVILELTALGGRTIVAPIAISDGLSLETIEALKADICRSYKNRVEFKPKGME